ncbi:MAG: hypothetical protein R3C10_25015 [Pirellulales bacterium]
MANQIGDNALAVATDVTDRRQVKQLVDKAVETLAGLTSCSTTPA